MNYRRLFCYVVIVTWLLAMMDWKPIHHSWMEHQYFPHESVQEWWPRWSQVRYWTGIILCPPCSFLAEFYYFALWEVEAGLDERGDTLTKHAPYPFSDGLHFWWGQGGEGNANPWKPVSVLAWFFYWLPPTVIWWQVAERFFVKGKVL